MPATVSSLAALVGGTIVGGAAKASQVITNLADLESAGENDISFLSNLKYEVQFRGTRAAAVLIREDFATTQAASNAKSLALIVVKDPYLAMAQVAQSLFPPRRPPVGIAKGAHVHPEASVDATASVAPGAFVDAGAVIGARCVVAANCVVGLAATLEEDVWMHAGSKLLDRCYLGRRVILQAGAVIGSDGFGYAPNAQGQRMKIPQVGIVHIEDDCEIGANTTVDRATFGVTRIGRGTKIDNLVQIAHNVTIGHDCVVVSQSGIAGSAQLGDRVVAGAQSGIVGHISVASDVMLGARAAVAGTIHQAGVYSGTPAIPHGEWRKVAAAQRFVPDLRRRVRRLEDSLLKE